jgi:UDP-N-acetylglucosamine enolpyruvyl transferase
MATTSMFRLRNPTRSIKYIDGSILTIADAPWPGFTPDLISIVLVVATQARGSLLIHQKMFESRLFFVDKLIDMGAKIILVRPAPSYRDRPRPQNSAAEASE